MPMQRDYMGIAACYMLIGVLGYALTTAALMIQEHTMENAYILHFIFFDYVCQWGGAIAILVAYFNFVRNPPLGQLSAVIGCVLIAAWAYDTYAWGIFAMEVILGVLAAYNLILLAPAQKPWFRDS